MYAHDLKANVVRRKRLTANWVISYEKNVCQFESRFYFYKNTNAIMIPRLKETHDMYRQGASNLSIKVGLVYSLWRPPKGSKYKSNRCPTILRSKILEFRRGPTFSKSVRAPVNQNQKPTQKSTRDDKRDSRIKQPMVRSHSRASTRPHSARFAVSAWNWKPPTAEFSYVTYTCGTSALILSSAIPR